MMGLMQLLQISTCVLDKADNTSNSYFQHPTSSALLFLDHSFSRMEVFWVVVFCFFFLIVILAIFVP